jgi:hypothetical protein
VGLEAVLRIFFCDACVKSSKLEEKIGASKIRPVQADGLGSLGLGNQGLESRTRATFLRETKGA